MFSVFLVFLKFQVEMYKIQSMQLFQKRARSPFGLWSLDVSQLTDSEVFWKTHLFFFSWCPVRRIKSKNQEMEEGELVQILKRSKTVLDLKLTHLHRYDRKLLLGY